MVLRVNEMTLRLGEGHRPFSSGANFLNVLRGVIHQDDWHPRRRVDEQARRHASGWEKAAMTGGSAQS